MKFPTKSLDLTDKAVRSAPTTLYVGAKVPLPDLDAKEREIVRQCLQAAVEGPFFPDWEFSTLFGLERNEVGNVLQSWPELDESTETVQVAISNSINNLLGYPHGCEKEWSFFISVSPE